jgi:outer membrane protein assembly complex protein YaeT
MKRTLVLFGILLAFGFITLLYFHSGSGKTRIARWIEQYVLKHYSVRIQIGSVDYSIIPLTLDLRNSSVYGTNQRSFLRADRIYLSIPYSTLWNDELNFRQIVVVRPALDPRAPPRPRLPRHWNKTLHVGEFRLNSGALNYSKLHIRDLKVNASAEPDRIYISELSGKLDSLNAKISGHVFDLVNPHYEFRYTIQGNAPEIIEYISLRSVSISGTINGIQKNYRIDGTLNANALSVAHQGPFAAKAVYHYDSSEKDQPIYMQATWSGKRPVQISGLLNGKIVNRKLYVHRAVMNSFSARLESSGVLDSTGINLRVNANIPRTKDFAIVDPRIAKIPGSYEVQGSLQGPYNQWHFTGMINGNSKIIGPLRAQLNVTRASMETTASLPRFSASVYGTFDFLSHRYTINGRFLEAQLKTLHPFLPGWMNDFDGDFTANFEAHGSVTHWKDSMGTLVVQSGTIKRNQITAKLQSKSIGRFAHRQVEIDGGLNVQSSTLNVTGHIPLEPEEALAVNVSGKGDLKLISLFTSAVTAQGPFQLAMNINGNRLTPQYRGDLTAPNFSMTYEPLDLRLTRAAAEIQLNKQYLMAKTSGDLNGSPVQLRAQIPFSNSEGELHFEAAAFPISNPENDIVGKLNLQIDAKGKGTHLTQWNGNAKVKSASFRFGKTDVDVAPVSATLSKGVLKVDRMTATAPGLVNISATGAVNFANGTLNAQVRNEMELSALTGVFHHAQMRGKLSADIAVSGYITSPDYSGEIRLSNGALYPSDFPPLEKITLHASLVRDAVRINSLRGEIGGGAWTGSGTLGLSGWHVQKYNINLKGDNFALNYPQDTQSEISADLVIHGVRDVPIVGGTLSIGRAIISTEIDDRFRAIRTALSDAQLLSHSSNKDGVTLDLKIKSDQPVVISNNLGNLLVSLDLQLAGKSSHPVLKGEIHITPGSQLYLQTRTFQIEHGVIRLDGTEPLQPKLDLLLSSVIQDDETKATYKIRLPLSGPINDLAERNPQSEPSLLPQQIYFLLLTGRAEAQLTHAESSFMRQQLMSYYSAQAVLPVPEKIAQNVLLNRAEIRPELISSERDPAGKVVNGKDFFSGVSLVYALPLEKTSEQTWIADYKIRKNIAFRLVDQDDGTVSSNLRHQVRFGKGNDRVESRASEFPATDFQPKVGRIQITNQSSLPDDQLRRIFNLNSGVSYGELSTRMKIAEIKQALQKVGHLYPTVNLEKQQVGQIVDLILVVNGNGLRSMKFHSVQPDPEQLERYNSWWREGFSENSVLGFIQQDLLQDLWQDGYHLAEVREETDTAANITYHFYVKPGNKFQTKLKFDGTHQMKDLDQEIARLYGSPQQMSVEAIHNFAAFSQKFKTALIRHGFLNPKIVEHTNHFDVSAGTVETQIRIDQGPASSISQIRISDGSTFPPHLLDQLQLKPGTIFHSLALVEDELKIGRYYEDHGYYKFKIKSEVDAVENDIQITYKIDKGEVGSVGTIQITGNHRTKQGVIEKQLGLKPGDILTQTKLAEAQKNLSDLNLFEEVKIQAEETPIPNRYAIRIQVAEQKNYELSYAAGYNSEKKFEGLLQLSDVNLFGSGRTLSFTAKLNSEDQIYRLVYHAPTRAGIRWKTLIAASHEDSEQPLLLTESSAIELQRQGRLTGPLFLIGSYRLERVEVIEKDPTDVFYVGEDPVTLSRISATVLLDTRDDVINPSRGKLLSSQISFAPDFLGSEAPFTRSYSQFYSYQPVGNKVWVSAVRFGLADPRDELIATERFFAGGSFTVRGFEKDALGPRDPVWRRPMGGEAVFIINQELRFPLPIHEWVHGVVFYDAGNVYATLSDFDLGDLRHSLGFGLRLYTPFGIGRIDLGFNLHPKDDEKRAVLHFALGQAF